MGDTFEGSVSSPAPSCCAQHAVRLRPAKRHRGLLRLAAPWKKVSSANENVAGWIKLNFCNGCTGKFRAFETGRKPSRSIGNGDPLLYLH